MHQCPYCEKQFSRNSVLTKHLRTAKYCIQLQAEQQLIQEKNGKEELTCKHCLKQFATKYTLRNHYVVCKANKNTIPARNDNDLATVRDLESLKELINNIATRAPTAPVVQNMEPVTVAHIEAMALEHLDISDIENGIEGIVDFTVKYPLQGRVVCTDKSRKKFRYTDETGSTVNDYGGSKLSQTIFQGIQSRCVNLIDAKYASLANDIKVAVDNNKGHEDNVLESMRKSTQLQNLKTDLIAAANGIENDLQKRYIRALANKGEKLK